MRGGRRWRGEAGIVGSILGDDFRREPAIDWLPLMGGTLIPLEGLEEEELLLVTVVELERLRGEVGVGEGLGERLAELLVGLAGLGRLAGLES